MSLVVYRVYLQADKSFIVYGVYDIRNRFIIQPRFRFVAYTFNFQVVEGVGLKEVLGLGV